MTTHQNKGSSLGLCMKEPEGAAFPSPETKANNSDRKKLSDWTLVPTTVKDG